MAFNAIIAAAAKEEKLLLNFEANSVERLSEGEKLGLQSKNTQDGLQFPASTVYILCDRTY